MSTEKRKRETLAKKQEIDATNLLLYNLNYEKNHFAKQIRSCHDFRGSYSTIELASVDDFKQNAPAELSGVDAGDAHKLMLNRLAYELQERKRLCAQREALQKKKQALIASNEKKSLFLSGLHQNLKALEEATVPIQENLGIRHSEFATEFRNAHHLPRALYVLYLQAVSYRDSFEQSIDVKMEGDVEKAVEWAKKLEEADNAEGDEDEDRELKRRKSSKEDAEEQKADVAQAKHPLCVVVHIPASNKEEEATLTFKYLTNLNIVTVESKWAPQKQSAHGLLVNLFPDDTGEESPNPANACLLEGSLEFDSSIAGRPYKWVQWLAGLTFLESSPNSAHSVIPQESFRAMMSRIHARIKHRVTLQAELSQLSSKKRPQVNESQADMFQLPQSASIASWSELEDSNYELQMTRGEYTLQARIQVSSEYPVRAPSFALSFAKHPDPVPRPEISGVPMDPAAVALLHKADPTNNDLQAMEEEVNVFYDELLQGCTAQQGYNLLSLQVRKLQMCLDIYVSTEASHSTKGGKICFRSQRGRARKRPFQFNAQTGLFDQRR
eukprot:TRINITY_DN2425_c0_g1_i5.p1 TRINITY_DN2425_c0_g1~~TRINITY_DN2425_c0_g1_i5.p1  ORF type:complete len:554 (-),score=185.66 TRINITY_DN2425_c0_g1_i5:45-1706(-)